MFEEKKTTFFNRILQIIDFYGIKSINSFAKNYLKYDSSEKINRLKDENKHPSFEILADITNKFEEIDANWLLTGCGEMLRKNEKTGVNINSNNVVKGKNSKQNTYHSVNGNIHINDNNVLRTQIEERDRLIAEKERLIAEKDERIREKDERIRELVEEKNELKQSINELKIKL